MLSPPFRRASLLDAQRQPVAPQSIIQCASLRTCLSRTTRQLKCLDPPQMRFDDEVNARWGSVEHCPDARLCALETFPYQPGLVGPLANPHPAINDVELVGDPGHSGPDLFLGKYDASDGS
jgi:hypothetical protein